MPVEQRVYGTREAALRPSFIQLINCKNILLSDFLITDGPQWTIHPVYCENVVVRGVTVDTKGPNTDGLNPDSCTDVLIEDCHFCTGDAFWDGEKIAHHYNAFTPFSVVIPKVQAGIHEICVRVDNTFGEHSALHVPNDYNTYGGITRARCHNNKGVVDEYRRPKEGYDTVTEMFHKYWTSEK